MAFPMIVSRSIPGFRRDPNQDPPPKTDIASCFVGFATSGEEAFNKFGDRLDVQVCRVDDGIQPNTESIVSMKYGKFPYADFA